LTHKGLGAEYEMCFYNPGTPPWRVKDGSGAWGADHAAPNNVAAAADWMIVTWPGAEGGSGIIGLDPSGRKRWGDRRGIGKLAADATYVYAFVSGWYVEDTLCRFAAKDGSYQPFVSGERPRPFDLPLEQIFGGNPPGQVVGMAVHKNGLALAMSGGVLAILDSSSAELKQRIAVRAIEDVAYDKDGRLYVLADGRLNLLAPDDRALEPIIAGTLERPVAITTDNDGNILVADVGPDSQVKAFSPRGGEPIYTCGKKGGRPIRGAFDKQAMVQMSSVAADSKGNVWVVENWNYPRRVSVWGKDGKLVRDYIGNTGYAGTSCYLHDTNPEFAYCGPVEFKLNKEDRTWEITQVMWVPDRDKGECFEIPTGSHINPQRFAGNASGKTREYLYAHDIRDAGGQVVYMQRNGGWQPVAAICLVAHISGRIDHYGVIRENPAGEMAGLNCYDGCYWNDTNKDGKVQRNECIIIPSKNPGELGKRGEAAIKLQNGWGGRIGPDLSIYTDGITRHKPLRFTDDGAPVYGPEGAKPVGVDDHGDIVPMPGEDRLIVLSWVGYAGPTRLTGINPERGTIDWYYPNLYPGVHGSHRAPMPGPGLLIGPLKTMGSAYVNDHAGRVFAMRGNLGQDFFMTTDGIYVDAMFRDARLPAEALPEKEESLIGMPMETFSIGGEPFNGWFGKQADGKIRMTTGMAREACMILEVKGLDTIRRFSAGTVSVDLPTIVKADGENTDRAKVAAEPKTHIIKKLKGVPNLDGVLGEWGDHAQIRIKREGQPEQATAWLAYDEANLHIAFRVSDATPWLNEGKDYTRLFKTGDAVDLQLSTVAAAEPHRDPKPGDVRIVFSQLNGKPVAVLMKPIDNTSLAEKTVKFTSPIGTRIFQRLEVIADARVAVRKGSGTYVLEASVPLKTIGLTPKPGVTIRGDLGFISSDARGMINTARTYWCNQHTNLVNDLPHEAWLYPDKWGEMTFE
ncbi:MAG: hypothetical protein HQ592_11750, partial [Planctomycetes bacterium]|nr:hypothetical protein [Planctomycetota bacterium]